MATYNSGSLTMQNPGTVYSATNIQVWVNQIRAALSAVGLVQTSDTGQINVATFSASASTWPGYEMWRFTDAAQATDPLFLKIAYGRSNTNSGWSLQFQVGQGSNGAGTLTGMVSTSVRTDCCETNGAGTTTGFLYAYFADGIFWLSDGSNAIDQANFYCPRNFLYIERSRTSLGTLDGRGAFMVAGSPPSASGQGSTSSQFVRWIAGDTKLYASSSAYGLPFGMPWSQTKANGDYIPWPVIYYDAGIKFSRNLFLTKRSFLSSSPLSFTASPFGTSRTWLGWASGPGGSRMSLDTSIPGWRSEAGLVLPWE